MAKKPKGFRAFDELARKLVQVPALGDGVAVKIVGKHPHSGKHGVIVGGLHKSTIFPDWRMWRVRCEDGSECFADEPNLKRGD